jgi:N-acetylmuramoyl-L-alanine amidase
MIDLVAAQADDILARTLVGEARGEGNQGMTAVCNVIMNRVAKPGWWGTDVKGVCLRPWQFSCWNVGDPNRSFILNLATDKAIYQVAHIIAQKAIDGDLPDITNGATSYYASSMTTPPAWAAGKTPCAVIGRQLFFADIN